MDNVTDCMYCDYKLISEVLVTTYFLRWSKPHTITNGVLGEHLYKGDPHKVQLCI